MNNEELLNIYGQFNNLSISINKQKDLSSLTNLMVDSSFYNQLIDEIDVSGESAFHSLNDLEMIYFFVHQKKDLNDKKNRRENTKREYLRDLLIFYKQLLVQAQIFDIKLENVIQYQLLNKLNDRNIRKYQEWIKQAPLGKGGKLYSVATLNRKTVVLKSFLSFLFENKYISL
ncbi:integrase, partial [Mesobacillus zeae]